MRSFLRCLQRLVEVGDDVAHVFNAHRQTDELGRHAGLRLFLGRELRMRRRGRVNDQRLRVADVRQVAEQLDAVDQLDAGLLAALDPETDDRALRRRAGTSSRWHGRDDSGRPG